MIHVPYLIIDSINYFFVLAYTRVKIEDIANRTYKNASYLTYHAHTEWTRKGFSLNKKKRSINFRDYF